MYFITTKRMLEVFFSAHPNIQYRTLKNKDREFPILIFLFPSEFELYRYTNSWIFLVDDSLEGIGYNKNSL